MADRGKAHQTLDELCDSNDAVRHQRRMVERLHETSEYVAIKEFELMRLIKVATSSGELIIEDSDDIHALKKILENEPRWEGKVSVQTPGGDLYKKVKALLASCDNKVELTSP